MFQKLNNSDNTFSHFWMGPSYCILQNHTSEETTHLLKFHREAETFFCLLKTSKTKHFLQPASSKLHSSASMPLALQVSHLVPHVLRKMLLSLTAISSVSLDHLQSLTFRIINRFTAHSQLLMWPPGSIVCASSLVHTLGSDPVALQVAGRSAAFGWWKPRRGRLHFVQWPHQCSAAFPSQK